MYILKLILPSWFKKRLKKVLFRIQDKYLQFFYPERLLNDSQVDLINKDYLLHIEKVSAGRTYIFRGVIARSNMEISEALLEVAVTYKRKDGTAIVDERYPQGEERVEGMTFIHQRKMKHIDNAFRVITLVPYGAHSIDFNISLSSTGERENVVYLQRGSTFSLSPIRNRLLPQFLNLFEMLFQSDLKTRQNETPKLLSKAARELDLGQGETEIRIYRYFKNISSHYGHLFIPYIAKLNKSRQWLDGLYFVYHRAGVILEKWDYLKKQTDENEWDKDLRYKKCREEAEILRNGFALKDNFALPQLKIFNKRKSSLYLLHNSLPYNSGGYATRSHGLITNVQKNSDFKVNVLARPGYPSDHLQHMSKPLPAVLPHDQIIDDISYRILDQSIPKASLTFNGYIEQFVSDIIKQAKEQSISIVHAASNYPNGVAAYYAAKAIGGKSIYEIRGLWEVTRDSRDPQWHESDQYALASKMETWALQNVDAALTITHALKDLMYQRGVEREIHVVPNAVDTQKFDKMARDEVLAKKLGLRADEVVIGYAGSIVSYEGLDDLMYAVAWLVSNCSKKFRVLIVGDGAFLSHIKVVVNGLNLEDRVIFTGRVSHDEVPMYISLMDVMPFPRKPYEVCEIVSPLKPFESLASGKSVVVSSCNALTEIIDNEKTGLVFKKGDPVSLAMTLKRLVENKGLRDTLAENGYKWVRKERDWKNIATLVARIYDDLYDDVLKSPSFETKEKI